MLASQTQCTGFYLSLIELIRNNFLSLKTIMFPPFQQQRTLYKQSMWDIQTLDVQTLSSCLPEKDPFPSHAPLKKDHS